MRQVNMHEAKTTLSELVRLALQGEEIILARNGEPLIRLVPVAAPAGLRPIGLNAIAPEAVTQDFLTESMRALGGGELEGSHDLLMEQDS